MISNEKQFLFIDIVKTGGTSVSKILESLGGHGKHHSIARKLPDIPKNQGLDSPVSQEVLDSYFKFTIVRNPYTRLASLYSHCQTARFQVRFSERGWDGAVGSVLKHIPSKARDRESYWPTDFGQFVEWLVNYPEYFTDFEQEKYITMMDWVKGENGEVQLDFIGRYESLQADVDRILEQMKAPPQLLPLLNQSQKLFNSSALRYLASEKRTRDLVKSYFLEDFHFFGYSKDIMTAID